MPRISTLPAGVHVNGGRSTDDLHLAVVEFAARRGFKVPFFEVRTVEESQRAARDAVAWLNWIELRPGFAWSIDGARLVLTNGNKGVANERD